MSGFRALNFKEHDLAAVWSELREMSRQSADRQVHGELLLILDPVLSAGRQIVHDSEKPDFLCNRKLVDLVGSEHFPTEMEPKNMPR